MPMVQGAHKLSNARNAPTLAVLLTTTFAVEDELVGRCPYAGAQLLVEEHGEMAWWIGACAHFAG